MASTSADLDLSIPEPLEDVAEDTAIEYLTVTRDVVASDALQNTTVEVVHDLIDQGFIPDAIEERALDAAYDAGQAPLVDALNALIEDLKDNG
jgi:hypothetical protein